MSAAATPGTGLAADRAGHPRSSALPPAETAQTETAAALAPSPEPLPDAPIIKAQPASGRHIRAAIEKAAAKYQLSPVLISSVIQAESNFQVRAVSPAGALGLMQLMPATASEMGVKDPFDIDQNIDGGARYLRRMLDLFKGNLKQALSAYNAGPGTVMKYEGEVPYPETRLYVRKVLAYAAGNAPAGLRV